MSGNVWFTSDLHFGHRKVAELRGFDTPADHDAAVVDNWLSMIHPKDQVWVLGDIAVGNPALALRILAALPGEKHLIWGNHDQGHPMHRNAHRKAAQYTFPAYGDVARPRGVFASAQMAARRRINGRSVLLSHFPYCGDTDGREGDRHVEWRLQMGGAIDDIPPVVHGHTHSEERFSWAHESVFSGWDDPAEVDVGAQVHVGLDAWGLRPVSLAEVDAVLADAPRFP